MGGFRSFHVRSLVTLTLILITALLSASAALASPPAQTGAETVRYGEQKLGRITPENRAVFYYLRAERGDVISITMRRTSGGLDPTLDLATAEGAILVTNDDDPFSEGTLNAGIRDYAVLKSGVYLIRATGFGNTEGSFVLTVTQTPPEEIGQTLERPQLIDYGMTVQIALTEAHSERYFSFSAEAGDILTVTARSDDLPPTVAILDSAANELARASDNERTGRARITVVSVPSSGMYALAVGAARKVERDAQVEIELSGRAAPHPDQPQSIAYGAVVSGLITAEDPAEEYVFTGSAGDIVRISLERASGDLDPLVTLYAQDRKQIAFDDDSAEDKDALIGGYSLPYDGLYIISASRYQRASGQTAGAYILRLERIGTGE